MRVLDRRDGTIVIKIHGCGERVVCIIERGRICVDINHVKIESIIYLSDVISQV